jgi:hypothetical protein
VYEHSPREWADRILPRMARKAKLTKAEYDDVLAYVTYTSAQTPPAQGR